MSRNLLCCELPQRALTSTMRIYIHNSCFIQDSKEIKAMSLDSTLQKYVFKLYVIYIACEQEV